MSAYNLGSLSYLLTRIAMRCSSLRLVCLLVVVFTAPVHALMQASAPGFSTCIAFVNQLCDQSLTSIDLGPATVNIGAFATLNITNPGTAPLVINYSFSSPDFAFGLAQTLPPNPLTIQPGTTVRTFVVFLPTATGHSTAQFISNDNAPGSPHIIPLSGTGITVPPNDFAVMLDPVGPSTITLTSGATTKFPVYVLEGGGINISAAGAIQCSGGPPGSTCALDQTVFPAFAGQERFIVSVSVPAKTGSLHGFPLLWEGLAGLPALVLMYRRRRSPGLVPLVVVLLLACGMVSCGGSSASSPPINVTSGVNGASHDLIVPVTLQ